MPVKKVYKKRPAQKKRTVKPKAKSYKPRARATKGKYSKRGLLVPTKITNQGGLQSCSTWLAKSPMSAKVRAMERVGQPNVVAENFGAIHIVTNGNYGAKALAHMSNLDLQSSVFQVLPVSNVAAGPRSCVLETYHSDISFTNSSMAGTEVELYDIVLKKDIPRINQINLTSSLGTVTYTCSANPVDYVVQGIAAGSGASVVPATSLQIGTSIFDSSFFNDYFKVVKRTVIQMSAGASHRHTVSLSPNYLLKEDVIKSVDIAGYRGLNCFTMLFVRPYPSFLATGVAGSPPTLPTTGSPEIFLNIIQTIRYKWTYVQDFSRGTTYLADQVQKQVPGTSTLFNVNATSGLFQQNVSCYNVPAIPIAPPKIDT